MNTAQEPNSEDSIMVWLFSTTGTESNAAETDRKPSVDWRKKMVAFEEITRTESVVILGRETSRKEDCAGMDQSLIFPHYRCAQGKCKLVKWQGRCVCRSSAVLQVGSAFPVDYPLASFPMRASEHVEPLIAVSACFVEERSASRTLDLRVVRGDSPSIGGATVED